ncbi:hypothetical protein FSPOR_519 [Fusarium sporotrichioides]|uniref:Apple domain-containing protein n=1 Tax=Fusarium sporotrichioides TaxID=5514 RepID=A0A395STB9_FUSSP|nr:hypothetical protein FSPOR_519 [Fusarium sporotrichioides]
MPRFLVLSFILAVVLGALVNAEPCKASLLLTTSPPTMVTTIKQPGETAETVMTCVGNKWSPSPKGMICGRKGYTNTEAGYIKQNFGIQSELECLRRCKATRPYTGDCVIFNFERDISCGMWTSMITINKNETAPGKWYEPGCFCDYPYKEFQNNPPRNKTSDAGKAN